MSKGGQKPPDNPCQIEQDISYKCLSKNNYDKERCEIEFINYTNCMKFWTHVKFERRRQRIYPEMPSIEEREKIKAEHFKVTNKPQKE